MLCWCAFAWGGLPLAAQPFHTLSDIPSHYRVRSLLPLSDGGYFLVGSCTDVEDYGDEYITADIFALRLAADGTLRYHTQFGNQKGDYTYGAAEGAGGTTWLVAQGSGPRNARTTPDYGRNDAWLVQLDATGQRVRQLAYGTDGEDYPAYLGNLPNGHLLLVLVVEYGSGRSAALQAAPNSIWVAELDPAQGTLLRQAHYPIKSLFRRNFPTDMPSVAAKLDKQGNVLVAWNSWPFKEDRDPNETETPYSDNLLIVHPDLTVTARHLNDSLPTNFNIYTPNPHTGMAPVLPRYLDQDITYRGYRYFPATGTHDPYVLHVPPLKHEQVTPLPDGGFLLWGLPLSPELKRPKVLLELSAAEGKRPPSTITATKLEPEDLVPKPLDTRTYFVYRYNAAGDPTGSTVLSLPGNETLAALHCPSATEWVLVKHHYDSPEAAATTYGAVDSRLLITRIPAPHIE
jgi:hypothetical protein